MRSRGARSPGRELASRGRGRVFIVVDLPDALPPTQAHDLAFVQVVVDTLEHVQRAVVGVHVIELEQRLRRAGDASPQIGLDDLAGRAGYPRAALGDLLAVVEHDHAIGDG